jgi:hypothetical protein
MIAFASEKRGRPVINGTTVIDWYLPAETGCYGQCIPFAYCLKRYRWAMLSFPNHSRVFDPTRRAVRFWGYDSAMEWSFFVTEGALKRLQPSMGPDEASLLRAFDNNRNAVHVAATRAYKRERKGSYELSASDF